MYLGIDLGTSSVKTVLFDRDQRLIASASEPLGIDRPHPGWSEQDPNEWWDAVEKTVDAIARDHELAELRGIGLSGQMHGAVCLDHDDRVLRPAILWNDGRAAAECAEIEAAFPRLREVAGNIAMPGFTAPKLAWVRKHEPEVFAHVDAVLLPKDYVRLRLTGDHVSEMSDAAGTLWLDVGRARLVGRPARGDRAHPRAHAAAGRGQRADRRPPARARRTLGRRRPGGGRGRGRRQRRRRLRHRRGAAGRRLSSRSAPPGVLFVSNAAFSPNTRGAVHAFCHAIPDTWHQMGVILSATDSLDWLARIAGRRPAELADAVGRPSAPWRGDLPALPLGRAHAAQRRRRPRRLRRARARPRARAICAGGDGGRGVRLRRLPARARGRRHRLRPARSRSAAARVRRPWLKIIATKLDRPLLVAADGEFGGALGAARLALCAAEGADPLEVCAAPEIRRVIEPDRALVAAYAEAIRALPRALSRHRGGPHMTGFFNGITPVEFKGAGTDDPLAYRFYEPGPHGARQADGGPAPDRRLPTGTPSPGRAATRSAARTFERPWFGDGHEPRAGSRPTSPSSSSHLLGVPFFCFHDRDVAPEGATLAESNRNLREIADALRRAHDRRPGIKLLWGTANLFSQPPLHGGRGDQPRPGRLRLRRRRR